MKTLVDLRLSDIREMGAQLLRELKSKLEYAELNLVTRLAGDEGKADALNGIKLLLGSQDTIERFGGTRHELVTEWGTPTHSQVYLEVEELILKNSDMPVTMACAHSSPNARLFENETSDQER